MGEIKKDSSQFVGYEYKEIDVQGKWGAVYLNCYPSFGWQVDESVPHTNGTGQKVAALKRDRKIINKVELTRLQRHFESCMKELDDLERSKTTNSTIFAIIVGFVGTVFMAGATFAAVHVPPLWTLTVLLAIPGFIGWILPFFLYQHLTARRTKVVAELIDQKYDEIYEICEKGSQLLL